MPRKKKKVNNTPIKVGDYVMVPFGKSKITGVVWDEFEKNNNKNC